MINDEFDPAHLLAVHFSGEEPLQVEMAQCGEVCQRVSDSVAHFSCVKVQRPYGLIQQSSENHAIGALYVESIRRYGGVKFTLERSEQGWLTIAYKDMKRKVSAWDEIVALAEACQQVAELYHLEVTKRQKIRELQRRTILAQVQKLARQEQFAYYTEVDGTSFKVYIRLANADTLKIAIPYEQFQATIPTIQNAIGSLRESHQQGVQVRAGEKEPFGWRTQERWILPSSQEKAKI